MLRSPLVRLIAAAAAGVLTALALLALLQLVNGGAGFAHTAAATAFGWAIPILACAVGALLGWALLRPISHVRDADVADACRCPQCRGDVLSTWRICPHCGALIADAEATSRAC